MIPKTIERKHIIQSINEIDTSGYDSKHESTKFDLLHNGRRYPPKVVISMAYSFVTGTSYATELFSGGKESNDFLRVLGFSIVDKKGNITGVSIQSEDDDETYSEGKEKYVTHKVYERNLKLVKTKKENTFIDHGNLKCEVCGFDFHETYGVRGYGYIECHHNKPVSEMNGEREVKLEDLSLLCSNCHKIIHRSKPWINVHDLKVGTSRS